jgi:hypothetical protein
MYNQGMAKRLFQLYGVKSNSVVCKLVIAVVLLATQILTVEHGAVAQTPSPEPLPADLLFTGKESLDSPPTIFLVDADTLEPTPIYTDETALDLRVMSVSPQGDLLAVLHVLPKPEGAYGYPTRLCIVTLSGDVQTCFQDSLATYYRELPELIEYQYTVTWSVDGTKVYFVTEDTARGTCSLVEADPSTGEILRTLYEIGRMDDHWIPTILTWSPDLKYVAAGVMRFDRSGILVNLETGEQRDLSEIVVSWRGGDMRDQPEGTGYVCNSFSPQGTYLTAIDEYSNHLIVFDTELQVVDVIDDFGGDRGFSIYYCPAWSLGESTLYFLVYDTRELFQYVVTYSLREKRIVEQIQASIYPFWPPQYSPDRTHMAFAEMIFIQDDPTQRSRGSYTVKVLYPDGEIHGVGDSYVYSSYPIWRPVTE